MTAIDQLKSVLCDSEGKCCITGSDEDRAIVDRALEALEQQAEPTCPDCKAAVLYECIACSSNNYPPQPQAEPVQRKPLTDKEITDAWCDTAIKCHGHGWSVIAKEFARVIERAHGIKEDA